ncbi:hypothetical protein Psi02_74730 [Planotetraspora silvatica]|uniref:Uncharacterized protein n=1 Tax=Planotetraspora silvatica TaxID=234614 RepID=A0A8J3XSA4_9ACTN|nr:hypothetical protein Psi02_74730 [Planotetraspora silvatica]
MGPAGGWNSGVLPDVHVATNSGSGGLLDAPITKGPTMSPLGKYYVGAGIVAVLAILLPLPSLLTWLVVIVALGAPVAGYFMLDESQRARLRRVRRRGIGR